MKSEEKRMIGVLILITIVVIIVGIVMSINKGKKEVRQTPNPSGILWKNVMNEIYSSKGINKKEFPDYDGITRRAYDSSNGLLANYSSGNYGWYDKNNLPGYSKSTGTTKESTTSDKNSQETSKVTSVASSTNSNVHKPQGTTANKSGSNTAE